MYKVLLSPQSETKEMLIDAQLCNNAGRIYDLPDLISQTQRRKKYPTLLFPEMTAIYWGVAALPDFLAVGRQAKY